MSTAPEPATFRYDVEQLLSPISADAPSGEALRGTDIWKRIQELRRDEDPQLPQGVWQVEVKRADWRAVENECLKALETRSKDLYIAGWLSEAWLRLQGFAGLRTGLQLMVGLVRNFWPTVHPQPVDGDIEYRLAPLEWFDERITPQVKQLPLTLPETGDAVAHTLGDWEMARRFQPRGRGSRDEGEFSMAKIEQSAGLTPTAWLRHTGKSIQECIVARQQLFHELQKELGNNAPSLTQLRNTLESAHGLVYATLQGRADVSLMQEGPEEEIALAEYEDADEIYRQPIRSRAEAYQRLTEAAEYLFRTEPHSPVPYLIRRAIVWGGMSLEELLPELIRNSSELGEVTRLLQLRNPDH